jgi:hypothetical protein
MLCGGNSTAGSNPALSAFLNTPFVSRILFGAYKRRFCLSQPLGQTKAIDDREPPPWATNAVRQALASAARRRSYHDAGHPELVLRCGIGAAFCFWNSGDLVSVRPLLDELIQVESYLGSLTQIPSQLEPLDCP